ncbi:MAG: agmatine deiminase family protein [Bacteroidales bacterium]|nr:agmatine deiminase family protein [Bacteroidales bacterium]
MQHTKILLLTAAIIWSFTNVFAQQLSPEALKKGRWLSQEEYDNRKDVSKFFEITDAPEGPVNPVAEFEPMQGVLIAYPFGIPMNLIVEMSEVVNVTTIVANSSQENSVTTQYENAGVNMDHVDFLIEPHDTYWTRDYGPWFIREEDKVSIVNFTYNRPRPDDDVMPINIAEMIGVDYYNMPVIHTGGNYMCDGFGIAAQTELVYEENTMSDEQVDQNMQDYLGVTENYVVTDPMDDYIMHIDCWGKFLDHDKVLITEVPESDYRYDDYEAAAEYFASRNCAYGYPWEVIRVYGPGDYPYTPYTNSLILNNKVFLPITGSTHDAAAIATYEAAMPGYEIVTLMAGSNGWLNSDALHCRTHEIADVEMLKITHIPMYHGDNVNYEPYYINAKVHAYSNQNLYADSVKVYYKINDGEYSFIVMENTDDENYTATIPASFGDKVSYYIHAADESGRSENMPYIGAADPFVFTVLDGVFLTLTPDTLTYGEQVLTISNTGTESIDILDITEQEDHSWFWSIASITPEITEYPYTINPGETVVVELGFSVSKEIVYDSILVVTQDNTYFSIVTGDDSVLADELTNTASQVQLLPNPMTGQGELIFNLNETATVVISIYNMQGQLIRNLENNRLSAGQHSYTWDGQDKDGLEIKNSIYFVSLQIDSKIITKKWVKL